MDPKRICWETPVVALLVVSKYKYSADESRCEAEHDARGDISPSKSLHAHGRPWRLLRERPRRETRARGLDVQIKRSRTAGRRDISEGVASE